jgi:hypothetical protein
LAPVEVPVPPLEAQRGFIASLERIDEEVN